MILRYRCLAAIGCALLVTSGQAWGADGAQSSAAKPGVKQPNIVLIMSDDMGFSDLGCYGGEIGTPNLDKLAAGGVRFTQFYNTARCCPTRASLLTGLYPHQAGVGHMTSDQGHDGYRGELNQQCATIAEVLRPAGYSTYMCGKWHVTRNDGPQSDKSAWPLQRGFDKFYGTIRGGGNFYDPTGLCRQNTFITPEIDSEYRPDSYYYTDALSDNAVRYVAEHSQESPERPFFLYLAYTAAHWPMHALEKDIAKYRGKYDVGFEPVRVARFERLKQLGFIPPDTKLTQESDAWDQVSDKAWEARCMEVYAAMIDNMDAGIGRIVSQLKKDGQFDNTLILFLQDNGGCAEEIGRQPNGDGPGNLKALRPDELQTRVTPPMQTRDGRWVRTGPGVMPGPADTFVAYGRDWARVSNTPFREFKHWNHEGGISTPLIAHWPAATAMQGRLYHEPAHLIDIMATCVDLSGAKYPPQLEGRTIKPMEGVSLRPALSAAPLTQSARAIFWEHEENRAVREGRWKLVSKANSAWELYDIETDRTELRDLAAKQPDRVRDLAAKWEAYAARANVLPLGAWRGKNAPARLSRERRFTLKAKDHLPRDKAPAIVGRAFTIQAEFETDGAADGVLVAQGGSAHGYSLFLQGGKLVFLVRSGEDVAKIATPIKAAGAHTATARLAADGGVTLAVDGIQAAKGEAKLLVKMPLDGLDVGRDQGGAVGPYESPYDFGGTIRSIKIELETLP